VADKFSKDVRSKIMSNIRSKWTGPEKKVHNYLKSRKIRHKMHPDIFGNPDILLKGSNTLIFIDSCFFHKCPKCYKEPQSNRNYWIPKIAGNVKRDKENRKKLASSGYRILRIWCHDLSDGIGCKVEKKIDRAISNGL